MQRGIVDRIFHVVDQELRQTFQDDYWKRCMYAASATKALLEKLGKNPIVVSGNFSCLVVSPDSKSARFQGFSTTESDIAHLWVECENTLLDLMPLYLSDDPENTSVTADTAPIAWTPLKKVPSALTYATRARYAADFEFRGMDKIQENITTFSENCIVRMSNTRRVKAQFNWVLSDAKILNARAQKGDPWAMSLVKYETMANPPPKPNIGG